MVDEQPGQPLYWGMNLGPYVDAERIQVHLPRVQRTLSVCGLKGLVVHDTVIERDKPENDMPGIGGMTGEGAALGIGGFRRRPNKAAFDRRLILTDEELPLLSDYRRPLFQMGIDRATAGSVVTSQYARHKDRTLAWGTVLDRTLRSGLAEGAKANMLATSTWPEKIASGYGIFFMHNYATDILRYQKSIESGSQGLAITAGLYAMMLVVCLGANKFTSGSMHLRDKRWSLAPSQGQPDRYLLARGMIAAQPLIRVRK
jgi:hypothetical protein